ncbi:MAG: GNAT superfamily N-acetyltransferase [Bradymonadia bacterium]|jgi:GNAT superfamily N-acetyltransferase
MNPASDPRLPAPGTATTPAVSIAPARAVDATRIAELFFADMTDLGKAPDADALLVLTENILADDGCQVWVARIGEDIAGMVVGMQQWSVKFAGRALWIEELYVDPAFRRRGLGAHLVEALVDWAAAAGYAGVELEAYRMNTGASVLYASLGFRRTARERYSFNLADWHEDP